MNVKLSLRRSLALTFVGTALAGCLPRQPTVSARHFILSPVATTESQPPPAQSLSIGIAPVTMPDYLLRNSVAVRRGTNEIDYLENAVWGERLDRCFSRTVALNISRLLHSDNVYSTDWNRNQVKFKVLIAVEQFDVDAQGNGTLVAQWRILASENGKPLKSGNSHLNRNGTSSRSDPNVIADTMSALTAEFSRKLAQSIADL